MATSSAIASAYVELLADASHFEPSVREGVTNGFSGAEKAARAGSDQIASAADAGFKKVSSGAKGAGESVGDELAKGSKKGEGAMRNLVESAVWAKATEVIAGFAKESINAASDMAEATSKAQVIFGDGAAAVSKFAESAAESMGLSSLAATDAASTFAVFGKSAGLAGTDLSGFATDLTGLAVDMASFSNTSPEQAIEAIGAALRGESEPIRAYGVLLDDATLKARAMTLGIFEGTGSLTAQQRVLAAQAEIMAQTSDAQGDFARTASGLANSSKTLKAEFSDLQVEVGQALVPVMKELVTFAGQAVAIFSQLPTPVKTIVVVGALAATTFVAISKALQGVGLSASTANKALGVIGLALTAGALLYAAYTGSKQNAQQATDDFVAALAAEAAGQKDATDALIAKKLTEDDAAGTAARLGLTTSDLARVIRGESVPAYAALADKYAQAAELGDGFSTQVDELKDKFGVTAKEANNLFTSVDSLSTGYGTATEQAAAQAAVMADLTTVSAKATRQQEELASQQDEVAITSGRVKLSTDQATDAAKLQTAATEASEKALKDQADRLKDVEDALRGVIDATLSSFSAELQLQDARFTTSDALTTYQGLLDSVTKGTYDGTNALRDLADAERGAYSATLAQAAAAAQLASDTAEANGATLSAADSARIQRDELQKVADSLAPDSPLRSQLEDYIDTLNNKIPKEIQTNLTANVSIRGTGGSGRFLADGDIVDRPTFGVFGERGKEAVIPITRPGRAMELMQRSGLGEMWDAHRRGAARNGAPIMAVENLYVSDPTDADLVAQRVNVGVAVATLGL